MIVINISIESSGNSAFIKFFNRVSSSLIYLIAENVNSSLEDLTAISVVVVLVAVIVIGILDAIKSVFIVVPTTVLVSVIDLVKAAISPSVLAAIDISTLSSEPDKVIIISSVFGFSKTIVSFVFCIKNALSSGVIVLKSRLSKVNVVLTSSKASGC